MRTLASCYGFRDVCGLAAGCFADWMSKLTADPVRVRALPDDRKMRPVGVTRQEWFRPCSSDIAR